MDHFFTRFNESSCQIGWFILFHCLGWFGAMGGELALFLGFSTSMEDRLFWHFCLPNRISVCHFLVPIRLHDGLPEDPHSLIT